MKRLLSYLAILSLVLICGCGNTNTIPHGFEWADFSEQSDLYIYIKYKQQVNGYNVSAICLVDTFYSQK